MKSISILISLIFLFSIIYGQKEANIWYFGNQAGLDFNSGSPVTLTDGAMFAFEGCASIADEDGNLLFYTDGSSVWNANHITTANGFGLLGNASSTQSAIIVKNPSNDSIYYIFTVPAQGFGDGLRYSEFNINLDGGLGDINGVKNIMLANPVCEKVTAVRHANGQDIWILAHGYNNNEWYAYLLDETGPNLVPVITNIGVVINQTNHTIGYMKASPDGTKVATVYDYSMHPAELLDFNTSTGVFSNLTNIGLPQIGFGPYGLEFSPNSNVLYIGFEGTEQFSQYDLTAPDIEASEIAFTIPGLFSMGSLQLGPDGKIYIAQPAMNFLSTIAAPDELGIDCDLMMNNIDLQGKSSSLGLPTFFPDFFRVDFTFDEVCLGDSTCFYVSLSGNIDSVLWHFDDPNAGPDSISTDLEPCHLFTDFGEFEVTLIVAAEGTFDTQSQFVSIDTPFTFDLGNDTMICQGNNITLGQNLPDGEYLWQDGSMNQTIQVNSSGWYSVTVLDGICFFFDSIFIDVNDLPIVDLGPDSSFCLGDSLILNAGSFESYLWQDASSDSFLVVFADGNYSVSIIDSNGCSGSDDIDITVNSLPTIDLGNDTILCEADSLLLSADFPGASYLWHDGSMLETFLVTNQGQYFVSVQDLNGCSASDSINIAISSISGSFLVQDLLCFQDLSGSISADFIDQNDLDFDWSNGDNTSDINNLPSDSFHVSVTDLLGCSNEYSLFVDQPDSLSLQLLFENESCFMLDDGSLTVLNAIGGTPSYLFSLNGDPFSNQMIFNNLIPGAYSITVQDDNQCTHSVDFNIDPAQEILLDAGADLEINYGAIAQINADLFPSQNMDVSWIFGDLDFLSCLNCLNPNASPENSGDFIIQAIDTTTGCFVFDTIFIKVNPADQVFIPNAFSPNADGLNDVFFPYANVAVASIDKFSVYNRWGQLLYDARNLALTDEHLGWDGTHKGVEAAAGVYVYFIEFSLQSGRKVKYFGDINLLR